MIIVFKIDQVSGALELIQNKRINAEWPRGCALSPNGGFLAVTGMKILTWKSHKRNLPVFARAENTLFHRVIRAGALKSLINAYATCDITNSFHDIIDFLKVNDIIRA